MTAEPLVPFTDVPGVAPNPTPSAMLKDGTGDGELSGTVVDE